MMYIVFLLIIGLSLRLWWESQAENREVGRTAMRSWVGNVRMNRYSETLEKYFAYYRTLDSQQKYEFTQRVDAFLKEKEFVSRGNLEITEEMKILVAACAVQLTFGLSPVYLSHFSTIILYPDQYYSLINQHYHVGEVNAGGVIVLSWKHFVEGYFHPNDSLNVGLHEMAHALLLENRRYGDDLLVPERVRAFFQQAKYEYRKIQAGEESVLRKYAGSNLAELFAVAVETFFENPRQMQREAPGLYQSMTGLLNQNPLQQTT